MRSRGEGMWWGTAMEAPDPAALAEFYSTLLEWPVVHQEPGTAVVAAPQGSTYLVFQQAEGYAPPVWPPADGQQRTMMHFDFQVADLDAAVEEAVALGAMLAGSQPQKNVRCCWTRLGTRSVSSATTGDQVPGWLLHVGGH